MSQASYQTALIRGPQYDRTVRQCQGPSFPGPRSPATNCRSAAVLRIHGLRLLRDRDPVHDLEHERSAHGLLAVTHHGVAAEAVGLLRVLDALGDSHDLETLRRHGSIEVGGQKD